MGEVAKVLAAGKVPIEVVRRYERWKLIMGSGGPVAIRAVRGFGDHALQGPLDGLRSSSLGEAWRVVYHLRGDVLAATVVRVSAHDYSGLEDVARGARTSAAAPAGRRGGKGARRDMDERVRRTMDQVLRPFRVARDVEVARRRVDMTVGQGLRTLRELQEMTQAELARESGLTPNAISAIENDRIDLGLERARRLARALSVHPSILIFPNG